MAYRHVQALTVRLWGRRIGVVQESARARGAYAFQYDPEWIDSGIESAPMLMPLPNKRRNTPFVFAPSDFPEATYRGLPPMLADALPDRFGNAIINLALAESGVSDSSQITALDRLAYVGSRAMGALTFEPAGSPEVEPTSIHLASLVESARSVVTGSFEDSQGMRSALRELVAVGTSPGGARAKAVLAIHPVTQEVRAGNIPLPDGFEQWLLKFDGVGESDPLGRPEGFTAVEYAYSQMAQSAGIEMMPTSLLYEGGRAHFLTRRFDRPGVSGERLHLQSLCAVAGQDFNHIGDEHRGIPSNRYETYFDTARRVVGDDDKVLEQMYRRMAFNVLASNCDDHTKNFAFLMGAQGRWGLSPAYDVTFAYNPASKWASRHLMSVGGKTDIITVEDLVDFGKRYAVPSAYALVGDVYEAVRAWGEESEAAGVPDRLRAGIGARLAAVSDSSGLDGRSRSKRVSDLAIPVPRKRLLRPGDKAAGKCGIVTSAGHACKNPQGSCPHHQSGR